MKDRVVAREKERPKSRSCAARQTKRATGSGDFPVAERIPGAQRRSFRASLRDTGSFLGSRPSQSPVGRIALHRTVQNRNAGSNTDASGATSLGERSASTQVYVRKRPPARRPGTRGDAKMEYYGSPPKILDSSHRSGSVFRRGGRAAGSPAILRRQRRAWVHSGSALRRKARPAVVLRFRWKTALPGGALSGWD